MVKTQVKDDLKTFEREANSRGKIAFPSATDINVCFCLLSILHFLLLEQYSSAFDRIRIIPSVGRLSIFQLFVCFYDKWKENPLLYTNWNLMYFTIMYI